MNKKYKVIVTYVEAGMGHIVAAEALANALETYYPDEIEVERCYLFSETGDKKMKEHEEYLVNAVKHSNRHPTSFAFLMFFQKYFTTGKSLHLLYTTSFPQERKKGIELLLSKNPDLVLSTHFTSAYFSIEANKPKYGGDFLSALYIPDPNVHNWWDNRSDLLIVNNPDAYREAVEVNGFASEKTMLSRFLVRADVKNSITNKNELRKKHGLPEDNFTVILASGAYAEGHLSEFAEEFLKIQKKFTLIIIAGTNEDVYKEFSAKAGSCGDIDLRVYGFRKDVHELYGAADIFVTKAGPNAILDSVCMGTPVMTNFYASLVEKITRDLYINRYEVGVHTKAPAEAAEWLSRYIDNPALLQPYIENCKSFVENCVGGEKQMADGIFELLKKRENENSVNANN